MKKTILLLLSIVVLSGISMAGDDVKPWSGKIIYSLDYDLPEAYESQRALLATEMTMYIGKGFTRISQQTGLGEQITINDIKAGVTTILMDLMGSKIAITTENVDEEEARPTIELLDETKKIAGYECKKARYTLVKQGEEVTMEVYYSEELPIEANTQFPGLSGFPMEYVVESQGMVITYSAKSVSQEAVDKGLSNIPDGYEKMSYSEFMKMMGGE